LPDPETDLRLRYVIFGGEALSPQRLAAWRERYPGVRLVNMYGITETTVHVTYKEISRQDIADKVSNIGRPIATLRAYLLDEHQQVVPQGVAGELYVGGAGVSRGYLGQPELTASRFVADPWRAGERLYRTGDLARLLPNGELVYLGRLDQQVQLHGYRIELGEITSQLQQYSGIGECTTRLWESEEDKYLVCYYVCERELKASELRSHLSEKLPDYMVPSYFVRLAYLPLTANGKLDVKALPAPQLERGDEYVAPQGPIEQKLVEIWSEVLKVDKASISVYSNFFELGGHSLRAMILVNRIKRSFQVEMPLKEIFIKQTIIQQSEMIETNEWLFSSKTEDMGKTTITI
jgi:acyl-CoA synthetase (AMP-forming)/AMP-acid ligase II/acyl carrier protein